MATIKEALAVAPVIEDVKAVVVREADPDVYGERRMDVLLAGTYARADLARVKWQDALAPQVVQQVAKGLLMETKGRTPVLQPIELSREPDLKTFVDVLSDRISTSAG